MCQFFSFVTEPDGHPNERFYFDWEYRKEHLKDNDADSHDHIIRHYKLNAEKANGFEYNPLTKKFEVDNIRNENDDRVQAEKWVRKIDFKTIVEPLIIKPIINPLELKAVEKPTQKQIELLKNWASVWNSVWASVWDSVGDSVWASVWNSVWASVWNSVWASVWNSVGDSVWASVRDSVWASVWDSVGDSVWASVRDSVGDSVWASVWDSVGDSVGASVGAYISTFIDIKYEFDFSSSNKLWEVGIVPSFDGKTWRLHSGKKAKIIYEISDKELRSIK